jgi:hypothetical protein
MCERQTHRVRAVVLAPTRVCVTPTGVGPPAKTLRTPFYSVTPGIVTVVPRFRPKAIPFSAGTETLGDLEPRCVTCG